MRRVATIALVASVALLGACGSNDDAGSGSGDAETPSDAGSGSESSGSDGNGSAGGSGGAATVELGGDIYEFSTVTCTLAGVTLLNFSGGSDNGSISVADPTVLVRLTIAGGEWVDDGSAPAPDRSGDTFTWTGPLSELSSGDQAEATITVSC